MYNILISGYYGFDNIGDESILRTLVTSLRERIPDCSLTVLSHDPAATREKYMPDGLHFNDAGHTLLAHAIAEYLLSL